MAKFTPVKYISAEHVEFSKANKEIVKDGGVSHGLKYDYDTDEFFVILSINGEATKVKEYDVIVVDDKGGKLVMSKEDYEASGIKVSSDVIADESDPESHGALVD